jgi:hypothetical protein
MMDNITKMNTNPFTGYPKGKRGRVRAHVGYIVHHFLFRIPRGRVRAQIGYIVHHFLFRIPRGRFVFMLVILSFISSLGYPEEGITKMNTNPFSGHPKEEMMDNITNINTNPSSGYPKEEMMDNITNMNTNLTLGILKRKRWTI